jgi:hypothetical protein
VGVGAREPGDAEVGQLDQPLARHQQVARRDVAMDHAERGVVLAAQPVGVAQRLARLDRDQRGVGDLEAPTAGRQVGEELVERDALDPLDHQERRAVAIDPMIEELDDAAVVEPARQRELAVEQGRHRRVADQLAAQALERERPATAVDQLDGEHVGRAAGAEARADPVAPDRGHGRMLMHRFPDRIKEPWCITIAVACLAPCASPRS